MITAEVGQLQAEEAHLLPAETLGSFYDFTRPCVVVALEASSTEVVYPRCTQKQAGIEIRFDRTFTGGKVTVST